MNVKGIIFDFGFTLFDFKEVSMEAYRNAYRRGMRKSIELLKEHQIFKDQATIEKFTSLFRHKRTNFFRKSMKTKDEYPTT